jgi:hypothetical protein
MAYFVVNDGLIAWEQKPIQGLRLFYPLHCARDLAEVIETRSEYIDIHAWRFTPASFELLLLELAWLGETDWRIERVSDPIGCEFHAWLRRGGKAAAAALSEEELSSRRLALLKRILLETRVQIDWLVDANSAEVDSRAGANRRISRWPSLESIGRSVARLKKRIRTRHA